MNNPNIKLIERLESEINELNIDATVNIEFVSDDITRREIIRYFKNNDDYNYTPLMCIDTPNLLEYLFWSWQDYDGSTPEDFHSMCNWLIENRTIVG